LTFVMVNGFCSSDTITGIAMTSIAILCSQFLSLSFYRSIAV
jgi:hypothetical protein